MLLRFLQSASLFLMNMSPQVTPILTAGVFPHTEESDRKSVLFCNFPMVERLFLYQDVFFTLVSTSLLICAANL